MTDSPYVSITIVIDADQYQTVIIDKNRAGV
jgi:hypothetical protein